ncbi:MAG: PQQ-dependent sugar dehydrogenase [Candidatus Sericytochromatia bacterium]
MKTLLTALFSASLLLPACATDNQTPAASSSPGSALPSAPVSAAAGDTRVQVRTVAGGLDTPWELVGLPDGRLLVSERPGRVRVIRDGKLEAAAWFDLSQLDAPVQERGEGGTLGLAVAPDFASSGHVYLAYTAQQGGTRVNRLVRLRESAPGQVLFDRLISEAPAADNHNGGRIEFGPDGKLYWATGENYVEERAQDLNSTGGKILRLNADGSRPADNPFPNSLVWSYGHRNPQGLAWDPQGNLYSSEHGPSGGQGCCRDEVNLIRKGQNYGWPLIRGDERREGMVTPMRHSGDAITWAPGDVAWINQGPWQGSLLIPGLRGAALYRLVPVSGQPDQVQSFETHLSGQLGRLRTVVQMPDGKIYLLTSNRDGRGSAVTPEDDRVLELVLN